MTKNRVDEVAETETGSSEKVLSKVFMNGGSQAIRIPAKWRIESEEVEITYDEGSKTVMLRPVTKEEMKANFIAQVRLLTKADREEIAIELQKFKRDETPWKPSPEMAQLMEELK